MDITNYNALYDEYKAAEDKRERTNLGLELVRKAYLNGRFDETREIGFEVLELADELNDKDTYFRVMMHISRAYSNQGNYVQTKEYLVKSIEVAKEIDNPYFQIAIYVDLSALEKKNANYPATIDALTIAEKLCEKHGDMANLSTVYGHFGGTYISLKKHDLGVYYYKKGLKITPSERLGDRLFSIGHTYYHIGNFPLALGYLKRALKLFIEQDRDKDLALCKLIIGATYLKKKMYKEAEEYIIEGYDLIHTFGSVVLDAQAYKELINLYLEINDFEKAKYFIDKFIEIEDQLEDKNTLLDFMKNIYEAFYKLGDYKAAFEHTLKYLSIKEQFHSEDKQRDIEMITAIREYEQHKKEAEIYQLKNVELVRSNKIIEEQKNDLVILNEEKDNIMNTISHDLKNYIGGIKMALEAAIYKDESIKENKYLMMIDVQSDRALKLVKDILYTKKLDINESAVSMQLINLNVFLINVESDLIVRANQKNITVNFEYCMEPINCMIDNDKFHRVLANLYTNAIKFTHPNGVIRIKTERQGDFALIYIKDSGIGISEESIPKLFEKFSGVGRAGTAGEESTGLGLSIVKKLVELHNGSIEVTSVVGEGTEFVVKIPCVVV